MAIPAKEWNELLKSGKVQVASPQNKKAVKRTKLENKAGTAPAKKICISTTGMDYRHIETEEWERWIYEI